MKKNHDEEFSAKKRAIEHTLNGNNRTFRKIDVFEAVTTCPFCRKRYAQFSKHVWQPDCSCINGSISICMVKLEREDGMEL
jgi:hypothetical protein